MHYYIVSSYGKANWAGLGYSMVVDQTGSEIRASYRQDQDGGPGGKLFEKREISEAPSFSMTPSISSSKSSQPSITCHAHYTSLKEKGGYYLKDPVFNEDSTLILSLSHAGDVLAIWL